MISFSDNHLYSFTDGPLPGILHEVNLPIIKNNECENMYQNAGYIEHIPKIFICAGYSKGGKDSCEVGIIYVIEHGEIQNFGGGKIFIHFL